MLLNMCICWKQYISSRFCSNYVASTSESLENVEEMFFVTYNSEWIIDKWLELFFWKSPVPKRLNTSGLSMIMIIDTHHHILASTTMISIDI